MAGYERHELERRAWGTPEGIRERFPAEEAREFLRRAIAGARRAGLEDRTGYPFGAVVVGRAGEVAAEGINRVMADCDPTAHAEVQAIRAACRALGTPRLEGFVLFSSSEPCPMCLAAAYWAGLDGVAFAAAVEDSAAICGFDDAFLYRELAAPPEARGLPVVRIPDDGAIAVLRAFDADAAG